MQMCGGKGTCLLKEGICNCYPGYAGAACEACADNFVFYGGYCMPIAAAQQTGDGAATAPPGAASTDADAPPVVPRSESAGTPGWVFGVAAAAAVLLLIGALLHFIGPT